MRFTLPTCRRAIVRAAAAVSMAIALFAHGARAQQRILFPTQMTQAPAADPGAPVLTSPPATPAWDPYADGGLPPTGTVGAPPVAPYVPPAYGTPGPYAQPAPY
ncbi:MAG TPA: hypothetical protein VKB78_16065, partial [Pirellulales bacterium]|nr:hypothetical protein [Pirellulales bacterium]